MPITTVPLKTLLVPWVLPPTSLFLLALLGALLVWRWRRLGATLVLLAALAGLTVSLPVVAQRFAALLEAPYVGLDPPPARLPVERLARWRARPAEAPQAIVLLSGGSVVDGADSRRANRLNDESTTRVLHAARLARATGLPLLITGGVVWGAGTTEAELMRDLLAGELGRPVQWLETKSRDTEENARFTADMLQPLGIRRVLLVTHAYHMRRAEMLFRQAGFTVIAAPHGFLGGPPVIDARALTPSLDALATTRTVARECLGLLWYRFASWRSSTATR